MFSGRPTGAHWGRSPCPLDKEKADPMHQDINHNQRQQAADRLMNHLLQKGLPAPYKERLIGGFANPAKGRMPEALIPMTGNGPLGVLQRLVFAVEGWIRRGAESDRQEFPTCAKQFGS